MIDPPEQPARTLLDADRWRILLVEDDEAVRSVLVRVLVRFGHHVSSSSSAEGAIRVVERAKVPFDILVADVVLEGASGPSLHRTLLDRGFDLPVLYVSGHGLDTVQRLGVDPERDPFLAKPFSPTIFLAHIRDVVESGGRRGGGEERSASGR